MVDYISPSICLSAVIWLVARHSLFGELEAIPKDSTCAVLYNGKTWISCIYLLVDVMIFFWLSLYLFF